MYWLKRYCTSRRDQGSCDLLIIDDVETPWRPGKACSDVSSLRYVKSRVEIGRLVDEDGQTARLRASSTGIQIIEFFESRDGGRTLSRRNSTRSKGSPAE